MTDVERMRIQADQMAAAEAAGAKQTSAGGLTFPLTADAQQGLEAFKSGSIGALLLAIEGETVTKLAHADAEPPPTTAHLQTLLPAAQPCYVLYRWSHRKFASFFDEWREMSRNHTITNDDYSLRWQLPKMAASYSPSPALFLTRWWHPRCKPCWLQAVAPPVYPCTLERQRHQS